MACPSGSRTSAPWLKSERVARQRHESRDTNGDPADCSIRVASSADGASRRVCQCKVVRSQVTWIGAAIPRVQVLQQFDGWPSGGAQVGIRRCALFYVVQMRLLGPVVLAEPPGSPAGHGRTGGWRRCPRRQLRVWSMPRNRRSFACHFACPCPGGNESTSST